MQIHRNQLTLEELRRVNDLVERCNVRDGGSPMLYPNILIERRLTKNIIIYYQREQIVGFLGIYFFYKNACEISLLVAPNQRRQGLAKCMLRAILPLLGQKQICKLFFSTAKNANQIWLKKLGFLYDHSEYTMSRISNLPSERRKASARIYAANREDIPILCNLDEACFSGSRVEAARFETLLQDSHYRLFLAAQDTTVIGKVHFRWQNEESFLSDLAVFPAYQGRGWGQELLSYCVNYSLSLGKSKLTLDVETSNTKALNLYLREGFSIAKATDFWSINWVDLHTLLKT